MMGTLKRGAAGRGLLLLPLALAGCVSMPVGPTVVAMPPPNKSFELFVQDDQLCRRWAGASIGPGGEVASNQMLASTLAGAALGTVAGAVAGDSSDAAAGMAIGTMLGGGVGTQQAGATTWSVQRSYDISYQQCMYAKGNVIPGYYPYPSSEAPPAAPR